MFYNGNIFEQVFAKMALDAIDIDKYCKFCISVLKHIF